MVLSCRALLTLRALKNSRAQQPQKFLRPLGFARAGAEQTRMAAREDLVVQALERAAWGCELRNHPGI